MSRIKISIVGLLFFLPPVALFPQQKSYVSVSQEIQSLSQGAKSIFRFDIFYNMEKNEIITHHYYPSEFIEMSNRLGETKVYFPKNNTVSLQQDQALASTNKLLYYFVNNKADDLGLTAEGFRLVKSTREDGLIVTLWQPSVRNQVIKNIKVVFNDMLPIYAEYMGMDNRVKKKIYYSKYQDYQYFSLPLRITEISFTSKTDSTIRRSVFTNVKVSGSPDSEYFNYKVPENAKLIK